MKIQYIVKLIHKELAQTYITLAENLHTNKTNLFLKKLSFSRGEVFSTFLLTNKIVISQLFFPYNSLHLSLSLLFTRTIFLSSTFSRVKIIIFFFSFFATYEFHCFLFFFPCTYTIKNVIRIKGWQKIPNFAKVIIFISQNLDIFSACFSFFAIYFSLKMLLFFFAPQPLSETLKQLSA